MDSGGKAIRLKERMGAGITVGGWVQLPSPDAAEIIASAGFDWVAVDLEHGGIDRSTMVSMVRAIQGCGSIALVRLMSCDPLLARQALDAGSAGVVIPHVDDADVFRDFVEQCTWPPAGRRSIGFFRANEFGQRFDAYAIEASDPIFVPMVESRKGIENLDAVLSTGLADAVMIGPYDLSASLGRPGDFSTSEFKAAEALVLSVCSRHGVAAGVHDVTPTRESIADKLARGYTFIACGMDTVFLAQASAAIMNFEEILHADRPRP